jgi:CBS domain-containing protein
MIPAEPATSAYLRLHVRRILRGGGREALERTVECPWRDRTVEVARCAECAKGEGPRASAPGFQWCELAGASGATGEAVSAGRVGLARIMTRDVVCVTPDVPLDDLATTLDELGISGVPVVDEECRPIGVVTRADLIGVAGGSLWATTVADVMMPFAFSVPEGATLQHAVELMAAEGVHRVPVVGLDGTVVGIVSTMDVVRWLARVG